MSDTPATSTPAATLFRNVGILAGERGDLSAPSQVLVRGNTIERISATTSLAGEAAQAAVIDGGGRVLMPGLIDAHWHAVFSSLPVGPPSRWPRTGVHT